jgi:Predicted nucleotide-binding protein containing TIR-like domain
MNSSDRDALRELGALSVALTVKSFASGLTPAARARAVFPAEFATSERAERADERIDAMQSNFHIRFSRSPGEPTIRRVEELAQEFRSRLADLQSDNSSGANFIELREAAEAAIAAAMAAYGNGPRTADLRDEIVKGIRPHLIPLSNLLPNKIFIGHGHSPVWREFKDFLQDNLSLPWEEFNRIPQAGIWTGERLSEMLESACFAFLIMTGEDERNGELHARENVIHEVGLFQGKLGFRRSIILLEDGCKGFSNIHGLTCILFQKNKISAVYEEVRRTLQREKII